WAAGVVAGTFLGLAYGLQTAGLELTTVASTGFITGLYVVFTPLLALAAFRTPVPAPVWIGVVFALAGLLLLSGAPGGSWAGNLLVLGNAVAQSFQIVAMERWAPRCSDVVRARRDRRVRGRTRLPRVDVGAIANDGGARGARVHARGAVRRAL